MNLNTLDYTNNKKTLRIIAHVLDENTPNRLSFQKILVIIEFILTNVNLIMFTRTGKPKTTLQLVMSFLQIIAFIRDLCRLINSDLEAKPKPKA